MQLAKAIPTLLVFSAMTAACGGATGPDSKVAEQFTKQFKAQCSLTYMSTGITPEQKTALCDCATKELLATLDFSPSDDGIQMVRINEQDIAPALDKCEAQVGVQVQRAG